MVPFLSFLLLFMAVGLSSGRGRKGKAAVEAPLLLEHHLPKRAHPLVAPLSDADREVLTYMLAFGLHLVVCKLQCKPRKGLKGSVSASFRSESRKPSSHKPSGTCGCFSCYSSFWSRWAASPNKDLINNIIDIAEMPEEQEELKATKGKEKKKQEEKRALEKEARGKKSQGGLPNVSSTSQSALLPEMAEPVEPTMAARTSMDKMYDALWDNGSKDEAFRIAERIVHDAGTRERVSSSAAMKDVLPHVDARSPRNQKSRDAGMSLESSSSENSSSGSSMHGEAAAMMHDKVDGRFPTHDLAAGNLRFASTECRNNSKSQRAGKRKRKVTPWDFEATFGMGENQEPNMLNEITEGTVSPGLGDANLKGKGFFCRVFPDTLCDIASRLWDLVSLGSRSHNMDHY